MLYPSIYLSRDNHPDRFLAIVHRARGAVPAQAEMRSRENHLVSERAMDISSRDWVWMGSLTATRQSYWQALARTTAFVVTADNVSYPLADIEALGLVSSESFQITPRHTYWDHRDTPSFTAKTMKQQRC